MAKRLSEEAVLWKLSTFKHGDNIRVRYEASEERTEQGDIEAQTAVERGKDLNVFVGSYENVKVNRAGEVYFLIYTPDRDHVDATGQLRRGNFRAFNPTKGRVLGLSKVR